MFGFSKTTVLEHIICGAHIYTEVQKIPHFASVKHCGGRECRNTHSSKVEAHTQNIRQNSRAGVSVRSEGLENQPELLKVSELKISVKKLPFVQCPPGLFRSNVTVFAQLKRLYVLNTNYKA